MAQFNRHFVVLWLGNILMISEVETPFVFNGAHLLMTYNLLLLGYGLLDWAQSEGLLLCRGCLEVGPAVGGGHPS